MDSSPTNITEWKEKREELREEYLEMYLSLRDSGYSEADTFSVINTMESEKDRYMTFTDLVDVQITLELDYLEETVGWSGLSPSVKRNLLFNLGYDIRGVGYDTFLKITRSKEDNKPQVSKVVIGSERMDKTWLTKLDDNMNNVASKEVRDLDFLRRQCALDTECA